MNTTIFGIPVWLLGGIVLGYILIKKNKQYAYTPPTQPKPFISPSYMWGTPEEETAASQYLAQEAEYQASMATQQMPMPDITQM